MCIYAYTYVYAYLYIHMYIYIGSPSSPRFTVPVAARDPAWAQTRRSDAARLQPSVEAAWGLPLKGSDTAGSAILAASKGIQLGFFTWGIDT